MSTRYDSSDPAAVPTIPSYAWVIVAACTVSLTLEGGITYSFGIFFKPLSEDFGWSRAVMSGVFSVSMLSTGLAAFIAGWLVDRFGPTATAVLCSFLVGLGLVLTSQVDALWQIYMTYGVITAVGLGGAFGITFATPARWFPKHRGLALGIAASGVSLGTLIMSPVAERLIAVFGWAEAYLILGLAAWAFMVPSALLLRRGPGQSERLSRGVQGSPSEPTTERNRVEVGITLQDAVRTRPLWMLFFIFFAATVFVAMVMVHVVNYATDGGVSALVAATFISVIGACSVAGRLVMGVASDRIGGVNALILCGMAALAALVWLIFATEPWMFYLFAAAFGFAYGGQATQMTVLINQFFGLRAVAALVGVVSVGTALGAALGSWAGGQIFDATDSYRMAFVLAAFAAGLAATATVLLKKQGKDGTQTRS